MSQTHPPLFRHTCDLLVGFALGAAIVFAPLAFGAVHFWAYTTLEAILIAAAIIWCLGTLISSLGKPSAPAGTPMPARQRRLGIYSIAGIALAVWVASTILPLPPPILRVLSPATYDLLVDTLPGWPATPGYASILGTDGTGIFPATWRPLALSPFLAHAELLRLLAYLIAFLLVAYYPWRSGNRVARRFAHVLIAVALFEAAYALFQAATGSPMIYWYLKASPAHSPAGTYINRNHFAGFVAMVVPIAGALALGCWARLIAQFREFGADLSPGERRRFIVALTGGRDMFRLVMYTSATLWLFAGLYCSLSRGGFLSPLAASCLLAPLLLRRHELPMHRQTVSPLPASLRGEGSGEGVTLNGWEGAARSTARGSLWRAPLGRRHSAGTSPDAAGLLAAHPEPLTPATAHPERRRRVSGTPPCLPNWFSPAAVVLGIVMAVMTISLPDLARRLEAAEVASSAAGRWDATRGTLAMIADHPLFGVGPGNFEFSFPQYRDFGGVRFMHVHNDYVELGAEAGLPALLLVLVLVFGLYRRAAATLKTPPGALISAAIPSGFSWRALLRQRHRNAAGRAPTPAHPEDLAQSPVVSPPAYPEELAQSPVVSPPAHPEELARSASVSKGEQAQRSAPVFPPAHPEEAARSAAVSKGEEPAHRHPEQPYLLWGVLVGVTALLLHSFGDFNLHIPANALVFAVLLGLIVRLTPRFESAAMARHGRLLPAIASAVTLAALLAMVASSYEPTTAEAAFRRTYSDSSLKNLLGTRGDTTSPLEPNLHTLERLAEKDGHNPFLQYATGYELQRRALDRLKKVAATTAHPEEAARSAAVSKGERAQRSAAVSKGEQAQRSVPASTPAHPEELARSASVSKGEAAALLLRAARHYARAARALPEWPGPHLQLGVLGLARVADIELAQARATLARAQRLDPHHKAIARATVTLGKRMGNSGKRAGRQ